MKVGIKTIIIIIFVVSGIIAFLIFSGAIKIGESAKKASGKITVWGTIPYNKIQPFIDASQTKDVEVSYSAKNEETFERELVDALASGTGPDLFIMSHEGILRNADKIFIIPYTSFPKEKYLSTYIGESRLFLTQKGILAFPFFVDPLVLYYNTEILNSSYLVGYPKTWDEFIHFVTKATIVDEYANIRLSGAALGTYNNIVHAKDIISMLLLQNGNPLVVDDPISAKKKSSLLLTKDYTDASARSLSFYSSFQDETSSHYSWNESLKTSRDEFLFNKLALYFDRMSYVPQLQKKNPNIHFGIAVVPQIDETAKKKTFGELYAVAISKHTKNLRAALLIASRLTGKKIVEQFTKSMYFAPARIDLLRSIPEDQMLSVAYKSAIISDGWVDPSPDETDAIFANVIRSLNARAIRVYEAVRILNTDIQNILDRTINMSIRGRFDKK